MKIVDQKKMNSSIYINGVQEQGDLAPFAPKTHLRFLKTPFGYLCSQMSPESQSDDIF